MSKRVESKSALTVHFSYGIAGTQRAVMPQFGYAAHMGAGSRRAARFRGAAWLLLSAAACTPSQNQLFTPPQPVAVPSGGSSGTSIVMDAGPAASDTGVSVAELDGGGSAIVGPDGIPDASFVWTETLPGKGTCSGGRFAGRFDCKFAGTSTVGAIQGSINLTLGAASEAQTLMVSQAQIIGFGDGPTPLWSASLDGQLMCGSGAFDATTVAVLGSPWNPPKGKLQGTFDAKALTLSGTITLTADNGAQCQGTWSAAQ